jgi:hypothetical protein
VETIDEKSTAVLRLWFYNQDRVPAVPTEAYWKLHDLSTMTELVARTALSTIDYTIDVYIPAAVNTIINSARNYETKVFTLEWYLGASLQGFKEYQYRVKNLHAVS